MTYPLRDGLIRFAMIDAATCHDLSDRTLELEDAKAMLRRVHGTDYGITKVDAINRFHDALSLAERIRDRRLFLVGESSRVHYPASGVGMNFCIQDAFNLGWKLAAAVTGRASDGLLDTYVTERLPEIKKLLNDVRRQLAIQFNFDEEHMALKRFVEESVLGNPEMNRAICENLAGLSVKYPGDAQDHALVGRRLPNLHLNNDAHTKSRFFELLHDQHFSLLDLKGVESLPRANPGTRLQIASAKPGDHPELQGVASVLVRPDGYVAWASSQPLDVALPEQEIRKWLNLSQNQQVFKSMEVAH